MRFVYTRSLLEYFNNKGAFSALVPDQTRDQLALDRNGSVQWLTDT